MDADRAALFGDNKHVVASHAIVAANHFIDPLGFNIVGEALTSCCDFGGISEEGKS